MGVTVPATDVAFDVIGLASYVQCNHWHLASVVTVGMLLNVGASTMACRGASHLNTTRTLIANVLTLGTYSLVAEGWHCQRSGVYSNTLRLLKLFECIESAFSLFVGSYQILAAGYVDGYDALGVRTEILRCFCVSFSLATLPDSTYTLTKWFLSMHPESGRLGVFKTRMRSVSGRLAVFAFQAAEVISILTFVVLAVVAGMKTCFLLIAVLWMAILIAYTIQMECNNKKRYGSD